jgi:hypothetical protein
VGRGWQDAARWQAFWQATARESDYIDRFFKVKSDIEKKFSIHRSASLRGPISIGKLISTKPD